MDRDILVTLLKSVIFLNVVKVIPANNHCSIHLHFSDDACENTTTNWYLSSEGTFFVNVMTFACLLTKILTVNKLILMGNLLDFVRQIWVVLDNILSTWKPVSSLITVTYLYWGLESQTWIRDPSRFTLLQATFPGMKNCRLLLECSFSLLFWQIVQVEVKCRCLYTNDQSCPIIDRSCSRCKSNNKDDATMKNKTAKQNINMHYKTI